MANQIWNDQKFQIDWNKLGWINPRNLSEVKNLFCVYSKKFYLKYSNKNSDWFGRSKLKPLDLEYFYKITRIIN